MAGTDRCGCTDEDYCNEHDPRYETLLPVQQQWVDRLLENMQHWPQGLIDYMNDSTQHERITSGDVMVAHVIMWVRRQRD